MMAGTMTTAPSATDQRTTTKNIEAILELEKNDERQLSRFHRVSHAVGRFVGTVCFVGVQCAFALLWVVINTRVPGSHPPFDPYPFPLLSTVLALQAVLLTSVVLTFRYQSSSPLSAIDHSDAAAKVSYKNPVPALMIVKITPVAPSAEFN